MKGLPVFLETLLLKFAFPMSPTQLIPMRWTVSALERGGTAAMGDVPAAVAEGARRATGATAAIGATEHPPPVSKISVLVGAKWGR